MRIGEESISMKKKNSKHFKIKYRRQQYLVTTTLLGILLPCGLFSSNDLLLQCSTPFPSFTLFCASFTLPYRRPSCLSCTNYVHVCMHIPTPTTRGSPDIFSSFQFTVFHQNPHFPSNQVPLECSRKTGIRITHIDFKCFYCLCKLLPFSPSTEFL